MRPLRASHLDRVHPGSGFIIRRVTDDGRAICPHCPDDRLLRDLDPDNGEDK